MKELSIEEKAKRYDEAIERAKQWHKDGYGHGCQEVMEDLFPELKESGDEKIRKHLISLFEKFVTLGVANECETSEIKVDDILYWLEKQDGCSAEWKKNTVNNKPAFNHSVLMKNIHGIVEGEWNGKEWIQYRWSCKIKDSDVLYWMNKSDLEKQCEQRPYASETMNEKGDFDNGFTRMIEKEQKSIDTPEFEIGDLITNGILVGKIDEIHELGYHAYFGDYYADVPDIENWHKWTIQDAKDGDVLATEDWVFIFEKMNSNGKPVCHCHYDIELGFRIDINSYIATGSEIYPATKEQEVTLFQKMKEAGYEWDADKKELKKIEDVSAEWKITDEDMFRTAVWHIKNSISNGKPDTITKSDILDWFKTLKDRVLPQPKQEWSEEDERLFQIIIDILDKEEYKGHLSHTNLIACVRKLKSLRLQSTWKPSKEQMNGLKEAIEFLGCTKTRREQLQSLLEQLKKLIE